MSFASSLRKSSTAASRSVAGRKKRTNDKGDGDNTSSARTRNGVAARKRKNTNAMTSKPAATKRKRVVKKKQEQKGAQLSTSRAVDSESHRKKQSKPDRISAARKRDGFAIDTPACLFRNLRHTRPAPTAEEEAWFENEHPVLLQSMANAAKADITASTLGSGRASKERGNSSTDEIKKSGVCASDERMSGKGGKAQGGSNRSKKSKGNGRKTGARKSYKLSGGRVGSEAELKRKLAAHNKNLIAKKKAAYEPRKHSIKDVRAWEQRHNRRWAELTMEERIQANDEITASRNAGKSQ